MKTTISISSYNQAEYLPDAIESVLNQKFYTGDVELIIVNDGSTDNSLEIANKYRSEYLGRKNKGPREGISTQLVDFIVINQVNKGLSSARNTGLMNATGDWFLPLDADDMLMPLCLYRIRELASKFSPPDIIGLSFKEFGIRDTEIILMSNPTIEDFKTGNRIGYCSAIKTSILKEVGGYSPRMFAGFEDFAIWFDLLRRGFKIVTIPEVLWLYRTKEYSMIVDAMNHKDELMNQIYKDFPDVFPEEQKPIIDTPLPK